MLDLYCERKGPGLLAEPLNASTNLAYLLAAVAAWLLARRMDSLNPGIRTLIALAVAVGLGSAAFHTFATPWARVLDFVPIFLFQLAFLGLYLRWAVGLGRATSTALVIGYLLACLLMLGVPPYLNGSIVYAPTLVVLLVLAIYHHRSHQPARWLLVVGVLLFGAALTFRTVDLMACHYVPFGTHFLWHLLTGGLLYVAMRALILKRAADPHPGPPASP